MYKQSAPSRADSYTECEGSRVCSIKDDTESRLSRVLVEQHGRLDLDDISATHGFVGGRPEAEECVTDGSLPGPYNG